jgi:hypothetical protein
VLLEPAEERSRRPDGSVLSPQVGLTIIPAEAYRELSEQGFPDWPEELREYARERVRGAATFVDVLRLVFPGTGRQQGRAPHVVILCCRCCWTQGDGGHRGRYHLPGRTGGGTGRAARGCGCGLLTGAPCRHS